MNLLFVFTASFIHFLTEFESQHVIQHVAWNMLALGPKLRTYKMLVCSHTCSRQWHLFIRWYALSVLRSRIETQCAGSQSVPFRNGEHIRMSWTGPSLITKMECCGPLFLPKQRLGMSVISGVASALRSNWYENERVTLADVLQEPQAYLHN
jgi:hypothetical protein